MTILVVEDDQQILGLVDRWLTSRGHVAWLAHDPDDASFVIAEHGGSPDVLLIDIVLGGRSGVDYARSLKATHPSIKVVFMTGWVHREPSALRTNLGPLLQKPFTAEALYEAVEDQEQTGRSEDRKD